MSFCGLLVSTVKITSINFILRLLSAHFVGETFESGAFHATDNKVHKNSSVCLVTIIHREVS